MRALLLFSCLVSACGEGMDADAGRNDGGRSDGGTDAGKLEDAGRDAGDDAGSTSDAGHADAGAGCAAMDAREGRACGPTEDPMVRYVFDGRDCVSAAWCECLGADCDARFDSIDACERAFDACIGAACTRDAECAAGAEWCLDGHCRPCDNGGIACRIVCPAGWGTYARNGCTPCECAPPNECASDLECPDGRVCYPGAFCWCSPAEPGCCQGNVCSPAGCTDPSPVGCSVRGCPPGQECDRTMCASSSCQCSGSSWTCTRDCAGGLCTGG